MTQGRPKFEVSEWENTGYVLGDMGHDAATWQAALSAAKDMLLDPVDGDPESITIYKILAKRVRLVL